MNLKLKKLNSTRLYLSNELSFVGIRETLIFHLIFYPAGQMAPGANTDLQNPWNPVVMWHVMWQVMWHVTWSMTSHVISWCPYMDINWNLSIFTGFPPNFHLNSTWELYNWSFDFIHTLYIIHYTYIPITWPMTSYMPIYGHTLNFVRFNRM